VADAREMCISMARSHRDWCKKNLKAWEDAKKEIEKMPDHPNNPPVSPESTSTVPVAPSAKQKDSTNTVSGR